MAWPAAPPGRRIARLPRSAPTKLCHQIGSDLVVRLADHRPDRGADAGARGAERFHRGDGRLDHAGERAAPAGMRGADHAGVRVGEQHRAAVRGRGRNREPRHLRHDRVGARTRVRRPGLIAQRRRWANGSGRGSANCPAGSRARPPCGRGSRRRVPAQSLEPMPPLRLA